MDKRLQKQHIPGTNPQKMFSNKAVPTEGNKIKPGQEAMYASLARVQERILSLYIRRLKKADQMLLQDFLMQGHQVGSRVYQTLPALLKEVVLKMQQESLKVMRQHTKNPFRRIQLWLAAWSLKSLEKNLRKDSGKTKKALPDEKKKTLLKKKGRSS